MLICSPLTRTVDVFALAVVAAGCRRFRKPVVASVSSAFESPDVSFGNVLVDRAMGADAKEGAIYWRAAERIRRGNRHCLMPMISERYNAPAKRPHTHGVMVAKPCDANI